MKLPPLLLASAGLGAAVAIATTSYLVPPIALHAETASGARPDAERFLTVLPQPAPEETGGLVPHLTPAAARDYAARFLARRWPSAAELAALPPFAGPGNIPSRLCGDYASADAVRGVFAAPASNERRMKSEIFGMMSTWQVLETGDCSCAGKAAPWEPVPLILEAIVQKEGGLTGMLFDAYAEQTRRELAAAERLCGGEF